MTDLANLAKFNMIAQQIRPWEVLDERVLEVIDSVDRINFVPEMYRGLAYADCQVPVCAGVKMFPPTVEGRLLQALMIEESDSILEIGTGSGFITTCLARLGAKVTSLEVNPQSLEIASQNIEKQNLSNIDLIESNCHDFKSDVTYDVIAITGSVTEIPQNIKSLLNRGGRMFVIVGEVPVMQALLLTRITDSEWITESLFETSLPALIN